MPIYEYECQSCAEVAEIWHSLNESPVESCPSCKGELKKIISRSSFQLKGGGWFADGYSTPPASKKSDSKKSDSKKTPSCPKAKNSCGAC